MNDVQQNNPVPQTKQDKVEPTKKTAKSGGAGFWISLMATLGFIFGVHALYKDMYAPSSAKGIYVVDGARLAYSYIAEAEEKRNGIMNSSDADYQGQLHKIESDLEANLAKVQSKIDQLSQSGMVVIQRNSVLAFPKQTDMTAKIAAELGISLMPEQRSSVSPAAAAAPIPAKLPNQPAVGSASGEGAELD